MFGEEPCLPIDLALGNNLSTQENQSYTAYPEDFCARLAHAYDLASQGMQKKSRANKKRYDTYSCNATRQVQDRVLVRNLTVRGNQKLADQWEDIPYVVFRKIPDLPVYAVRLENGERERVLHLTTPAQNQTLAPKDS